MRFGSKLIQGTVGNEYTTSPKMEDENYVWDYSEGLASFFLNQIAKPATKVAEVAADNEIHSTLMARI